MKYLCLVLCGLAVTVLNPISVENCKKVHYPHENLFYVAIPNHACFPEHVD
jgi:hypothetical protein